MLGVEPRVLRLFLVGPLSVSNFISPNRTTRTIPYAFVFLRLAGSLFKMKARPDMVAYCIYLRLLSSSDGSVPSSVK